MTNYQHWLPKSYLRGFLMSSAHFEALESQDRGLSRESLFVARLPDLTRPWECDGFELEWNYANLSEIGGSESLHSSPEADLEADRDLREFGRILKHIRKEMGARANGPRGVPEQGGPDDEELPSPVHSLTSVLEDPSDAAVLLRTIAIGKFRGPYSDNLKIREFFEKVLTGVIAEEDVDRWFADSGELNVDLRLLLEMRSDLAQPDADPRLISNALHRTLELARKYLPDGSSVHDGHALADFDEEVLADIVASTYGNVQEMHLLNNLVPWTCDAPFFHMAPDPDSRELDVGQVARFNVGVQLSRDIFLTSNEVDTMDMGAFFSAGRANPLHGMAQWLISPEPLDEVCLIVSSRPWEQPLPPMDSMEAWAASFYGWGHVRVTLGRSENEPRRWSATP